MNRFDFDRGVLFGYVGVFALMLVTLLTPSCAPRVTSMTLIQDARNKCQNVPEVDLQRVYCAMSFVMMRCQEENLDLRICGELER